jgi:YidC/Oxa1 family membrane protein insertase
MLEERSNLEWPAIPDGATPGIHKTGDFLAMGLGDGNGPSDIMIRLLEFCHVSTQLPWWASIALLSLILRITLFPLMLKLARNGAIIPYIQEAQADLLQKTKKAKESGEVVEMRQVTMETLALYRSRGYSPFVNFFGIIQLPVFFAMFRTCTRCSNLPVPGWETGGTLWFTNLTSIDPYFILPTISGLTMALNILVCTL